ncbi:glycosyl transferase [Parashewanella curva]|uniref:Glycosyl transferase n=1 Tax=Parashewanella curva TaxID=2338552 RepID=A0A3L8Q3P0_9GAMM|nr:ATP-grasp fold amidoligase family protein [Parashewanella curva]RLV61412.1 glycosyl transferase [Parashewanella curva]
MIKRVLKKVVYSILEATSGIRALDSVYLKFMYYKLTKKKLNLRSPKTLNEKLQYIKLYDRNPVYTMITDKALVKEYIANKGLTNIVIPSVFTLGSHDVVDIKLIDDSDFPLIVKSNHDSSGGLIIKNKHQALSNVKGISEPKISLNDFDSVVEYNNKYINLFLRERFKCNHYLLTKEWQYKNIVKKSLAEKLLQDRNGNIPNDLKFHCFKGKVEFIYVSADRENLNYRKIYYPDWTLAPFTWTKLGNEKVFEGPEVEKPNRLDDMIAIAEKLSEDFEYIRVDLYLCDDEIFFGEFTMQHSSGFDMIIPEKFDEFYGNKLKINL